MAIMNEPCDKEFRGQIDKTVVVRQYADGRTILSSYPNMKNIELSEAQNAHRLRFKEAQEEAVRFLSIPENKAAYKAMCGPGQRPHNLVLAELLRKDKAEAEIPKKGPVVAGIKIKQVPTP